MNINLSCPANKLGYGVVGINVLKALQATGHDVGFWPLGQVDVEQQDVDAVRSGMARAKLFDYYAPSVRLFHQFSLDQHVGSGIKVGLPIFELTRFTEVEMHHLLAQDLVVATSAWGCQVLVDNGVPAERIYCVPLGVDRDIFNANSPHAQLPEWTENCTVFLNSGKWELRKGHDKLITAFERAFSPADNVALVLHCHNPCLPDAAVAASYNGGWERMVNTSPMAGRILLVDRLDTQAEVAALYQSADCGVFPTRAEGWCLPAAEMLAMGKHLIITNYSAHTEYSHQNNSMLIEVNGLEPAFDGHWFTGQGEWAAWGENQDEQLINRLRNFHRLRQDNGPCVNQAGLETMRRFTWEETAKDLVVAVK